MDRKANNCPAIIDFPEPAVISESTRGSIISGEVPDGTLQAIDRLFDLVDQGVEHVDRILNRGKQTAERHLARKRDRADIVKASPARTPRSSKPGARKLGAPASMTALARKPQFYIVEAVTPAGVTEYVVTDGGNARAACPSRTVAEQILQALEKAS